MERVRDLSGTFFTTPSVQRAEMPKTVVRAFLLSSAIKQRALVPSRRLFHKGDRSTMAA